MGTRNHTHLGLLTAAQLSVTLLLHRDLRALCVAAWMLLMNDDQVISGTIRCLLYTSPSPRDVEESRMPSSA